MCPPRAIAGLPLAIAAVLLCAGLSSCQGPEEFFWEIDGAGILYWNRAAEQLYGYSRDEARGKTTHTLLRTHLTGGVDQLEEKLARYGVWVGELQHTTRDGCVVAVEGRLALLSQRDGRWLVLEVNRDITDRKRAEVAQKGMEERLLRLHPRARHADTHTQLDGANPI